MKQLTHLNLPVPPAYAFDYLSILYVKQLEGLEVDREIELVETALDRQLENFDRIVVSHEFLSLRAANAAVFAVIAKNADTEAQCANRKRQRAKVALQEAFWPSLPYGEVKTEGER